MHVCTYVCGESLTYSPKTHSPPLISLDLKRRLGYSRLVLHMTGDPSHTQLVPGRGKGEVRSSPQSTAEHTRLGPTQYLGI